MQIFSQQYKINKIIYIWLLAPGMDINNKHIDKRKCYGHILCSPPIIGDGHVVVKAPFGN